MRKYQSNDYKHSRGVANGVGMKLFLLLLQVLCSCTAALTSTGRLVTGNFHSSLQLYPSTASSSQDSIAQTNSKTDRLQKIIHWRGEKEHGNSIQLRHYEFTSALASIIEGEQIDAEDNTVPSSIEPDISFTAALSSTFESSNEMSEYQKDAYENAMQYINEENLPFSNNFDLIQETVQRCALVRSLFEIISEGDTFEELARNAIQSNNLSDMMKNGSSATLSWRVRLRQYGDSAKAEKQKQYGKKMRSPMKDEREAINQMRDLFMEFTGPVDLKDADISLYIFEGLKDKKKVLARLLTRGANTSSIAPKTRICITNTPLCPLASFTMNNVGRVKKNFKILDPFAGSCGILLATSMIEPSVQTVGIEIAHNGAVNRDNIMKDFSSRNLTPPAAIIKGDAMDNSVRDKARAAVENEPFDVIITDPPYNIREKILSCPDSPLINLVKCIASDRKKEQRLLALGGRLVVFVPNMDGDDIAEVMPNENALKDAGLKFVNMVEQPLNDSLRRWLVEYKCIA